MPLLAVQVRDRSRPRASVTWVTRPEVSQVGGGLAERVGLHPGATAPAGAVGGVGEGGGLGAGSAVQGGVRGDRGDPIRRVVAEQGGRPARGADPVQPARAVVPVLGGLVVRVARGGQPAGAVPEAVLPARRVGDAGQDAAGVGEGGDAAGGVGDRGELVARGVGVGQGVAVAVGFRGQVPAGGEGQDLAAGVVGDLPGPVGVLHQVRVHPRRRRPAAAGGRDERGPEPRRGAEQHVGGLDLQADVLAGADRPLRPVGAGATRQTVVEPVQPQPDARAVDRDVGVTDQQVPVREVHRGRQVLGQPELLEGVEVLGAQTWLGHGVVLSFQDRERDRLVQDQRVPAGADLRRAEEPARSVAAVELQGAIGGADQQVGVAVGVAVGRADERGEGAPAGADHAAVGDGGVARAVERVQVAVAAARDQVVVPVAVPVAGTGQRGVRADADHRCGGEPAGAVAAVEVDGAVGGVQCGDVGVGVSAQVTDRGQLAHPVPADADRDRGTEGGVGVARVQEQLPGRGLAGDQVVAAGAVPVTDDVDLVEVVPAGTAGLDPGAEAAGRGARIRPQLAVAVAGDQVRNAVAGQVLTGSGGGRVVVDRWPLVVSAASTGLGWGRPTL